MSFRRTVQEHCDQPSDQDNTLCCGEEALSGTAVRRRDRHEQCDSGRVLGVESNASFIRGQDFSLCTPEHSQALNDAPWLCCVKRGVRAVW